MHEFAIAQGLVEIIEEEALPYGGAKVISVKVRIGKLSGVIPDALRFAFEALSMGGRAHGASLLIEEVPLRIQCNRCRRVSSVEDPFLICPHCGGTDVEMIAGRGLEIQNMEIEDGSQGSQEHS